MKEALNNYCKGRANAKTLTYWVLTMKDFGAWFMNGTQFKVLLRTINKYTNFRYLNKIENEKGIIYLK